MWRRAWGLSQRVTCAAGTVVRGMNKAAGSRAALWTATRTASREQWTRKWMEPRMARTYTTEGAPKRGMGPSQKASNADAKAERMARTSATTWRSVAFVVAAGGSLVLYYNYERHQRIVATTRTVGKPALGGPFVLVDHDGKAVTDATYRGEWLLLYFGFTHCPDICPQELDKMGEVVDNLDAKFGPVLRPVFVSVDPFRDSVEIVREYVEEFHPRMLGLTGTPKHIGDLAKAYRVYFSSDVYGDDEDYLVDHSIVMYLVDPEGEFVDFYGKNVDADTITEKISAYIAERNPDMVSRALAWYRGKFGTAKPEVSNQ